MNTLQLIKEIRLRYGAKVSINHLANLDKTLLEKILNDISYLPLRTKSKNDTNVIVNDFKDYYKDTINI